jgi:hypothetical protein
VDGLRPVADKVPHVKRRDPWVPSGVLRDIVSETLADRDLLVDLADVRGALVEDAEPAADIGAIAP